MERLPTAPQHRRGDVDDRHSGRESRKFFLGGELVEIWENADWPVQMTDEDFARYERQGDWVMLFNGLIMRAHVESDEMELPAQ